MNKSTSSTLLLLGLTASLTACTGKDKHHHQESGHQEHPEGEHEDHEDKHDEHEDEHGHHEEGHDDHEFGLVKLHPKTQKRLKITTETAKKRVMGQTIVTTGRIDFNHDRLAHVGPKVSGKVRSVSVELGDLVEKGQNLIQIEALSLGATKANFLNAKAKYVLAEKRWQRAQKLQKENISSLSALQDIETQYQQAKAKYLQHQEQLRILGFQPRELASLKTTGKDAVRYTIRSPFKGIVVKKHAAVGEQANPEDDLFVLADLSQVWLWVDIYPEHIGAVHKGDQISFSAASIPQERFSGTIIYVSSDVEPSSQRAQAFVNVDNPRHLLKPGMFAEVEIIETHGDSETEELLSISERSVQRIDGNTVVFIEKAAGEYKLKAVSLGRQQGGFFEVLLGLDGGEKIANKHTFLLKSQVLKERLGGGHHHH